MRRLALLLLVLAATAGCGGSADVAGTHLTLTALNPWVGLAIFHLDCGPSGGDVADPAAACAALARNPRLVTSPTPFNCVGMQTSWFDVTIAGRLAGKPVHRKFSTCWTPQSATLEKLGLASTLGRHVRRRRHGIVLAGTSRTFAPGALRPGDLLICRIRHHLLRLGISDQIGPTGSVGWGGKHVVSVVLTGTRRGDGSVTATCRRGNP